jgi:hypothetical protein
VNAAGMRRGGERNCGCAKMTNHEPDAAHIADAFVSPLLFSSSCLLDCFLALHFGTSGAWAIERSVNASAGAGCDGARDAFGVGEPDWDLG